MSVHFSKDPTLSLREKLRLTYEERKESHKIDGAKRDKAGQACVLIGLLNATFVAIVIVNPVLYRDSDVWSLVAVQSFGFLCAFQILTNWLCMKYVDSSYVPFRHGTKPSELMLGERMINDQDLQEFSTPTCEQNGNFGISGAKTRKDANETKPNVMYVVNAMPEHTGDPLTRTKYPYFSWTQCVICNRPRPPRCHHCPLCRKCILRRDHHCFFVGNCIGYRNLRYFTTFLVWVAIASVYLWLHLVPYCQRHLLPNISVADLVLPVAVLRAMAGYISFRSLYVISVAYIAALLAGLTLNFLPKAVVWVVTGTTSFEREQKMKIVDTRGVLDKVRAVFGYYWFLNVLVPMHFWFEPVEDPVNWPSLKA